MLRFAEGLVVYVLTVVALGTTVGLGGCAANASSQRSAESNTTLSPPAPVPTRVLNVAVWTILSPLELPVSGARHGDPFWLLSCEIAGYELGPGGNDEECSAYHQQQDAEASDERAWREAGFSDTERAEWSPHCTPSQAAAWRKAGFSAPEAAALLACKGCSDRNIPEDASKWRSAGFTASEAASWPSNFSVDNAVKWRANGFDARQARAYAKAYPRITLDQAMELRRSGLTAKDCADHSLSVEQAVLWQNSGFSCAEAASWKAVGASPASALRWKAAALGPPTFYLSEEGVSSETAATWKAKGVSLADRNQTQDIRRFLSKGYSLKSAIYYHAHGVEPDQVSEFNRVQAACHGTLYNVFKLITLSPFATRSKCFILNPVTVVQWMTPASGLATLAFSGPLMFIQFDKPPTSRWVSGVFIGEGAYQYESASGSLQTVPRLRWIGEAIGN
jgi:hypothetical protein